MSNTQNPHSSGFNKINLLAIFLIFLTGCGGNYTEQVSKVVGKTKYLAPAEGNELTQGFENITLNSQGILEFKLTEKIYSPEYEAPIIQNSKVEGIKANPVGTLFATFFTLGLYPVIETKGAIELTAGKK